MLMELNVIEEKKNKLVLEVKGEDHTLCNALRKELWNDKSVKAAGYNISHPLIGIPKMVVETSGEEPKKALLEAAKRLKRDNEKLSKELLKELK
jgi:DNA-directed RNA polymerase subunit L